MAIPILELDGLVRSIGVNRESPHAFFLGAGASISSGVPSASACISHWKHSIFTTNNPALEAEVGEPSLTVVRQRIDRWLIANGFRPPTSEDEYGFFIEKCLPIADDRRRYFERWIRTARPHIGYRLLCLLAQSGLIRSTWSTNFDGLVVRAAADFDLTPIEIGIDSAGRAYRQPNRGELVAVSLHGDYRYDSLKNTSPELQTQDETLRAALVETLKTHSLVVVGYSGRDKSVMDALVDAVRQKNATGKLFWCGRGDVPPDSVSNLLAVAAPAGLESYFVPETDFDDLMRRLALHCLAGELKSQAATIIGSAEQQDRPTRSPFRIPQGNPTSLLKSNAWPIRVPAEVFQFDLSAWPKDHVWKWLGETTASHEVIAVPFRKVLAFGTIDAIRNAFGGSLVEPISRVPIDNKDLRYEDGAITCLMRRALVRSMAATRNLATDGDSLLWEPKAFRNDTESGKTFPVHHAARIALRQIHDRTYITLDPTFYVQHDPQIDEDAARNIRHRLLGYQHNQGFNADLNRWRQSLFTKGQPTEFDFPSGSGAFSFAVQSSPIFAEISEPQRLRITVPAAVVVDHKGLIIPEPTLLFAPRRPQQQTTDAFPLRGLSQFGPFDAALSSIPHEDRVRLGVVCPTAEAPRLTAFLAEVNRAHDPQRGQKEEYMVPYPGFDVAFRTVVEIPQRSTSAWHDLPEIDPQTDQRAGSLELSRNIRDAVSSLAAAGYRTVLVFTPERWMRWRGFKDDAETFDVHDVVKSYCVKQGIATQFLDQDTLGYPDKCRIWWWLSVALYAKAMRTPWILQGLDPQAAYVGLGYAFDPHAKPGQRIVIGCSHLYNAHGQGLQFRLSRIDNPIMVGRNPFLKFEDARRVGETIRTLFWQARSELPQRVVLHKLTPFRKDEQLGFAAGLEGVPHVEMIEVNYEPTLRYIGSEMKQGQFKDAMFPVHRGTAIRLTDHEALLWVHGSTEAVKPSWTYFQGKRRIPGPVVLRRYAGHSDLAVLASELLGLSKMDWNSGDLYSKLPATVLSSKRIASIGSLLDRFGETSYDYRLFM